MNEWREEAVRYVDQYARMNGTFMAPHMREWAYANGLPRPENNRAWGLVMRYAQDRGIIVKAGFEYYEGDAVMHTQTAQLWRLAA